jgi:paraquat-inducible protein A
MSAALRQLSLRKPPTLPEAGRAGQRPLSPRVRAATAVLLTVSLGCNVAALLLPFMRLRIGLKAEPYSLVHTVRMLWSAHLPVLAVIVAGFSILFPFIKWTLLAAAVARGRITPRGREWLLRVDKLGKWSMMDVFLVCLILALSSGQLLVGARPLVGLPIFVSAIVLSMTVGEILSATLPQAAPSSPHSAEALRRGGLWLALSAVALAGAIGLPFLRIHDWFVANKAYSIATAAPILAASGAPLAGSILAVFLVLLPIATWVATAAWWIQLRRARPSHTLYRLSRLGKRWSMLDVFGFALAIFAVEGDNLMKTEVRWGALSLATLVAAQFATESALARALEPRSGQAA